MPRPQIIIIPAERPATCADCMLCGYVPLAEVPFGGKFTRKCFLPGHERLISGRGARAEDKQLKFRCKPREYQETYIKHQGRIPISRTAMERYKVEQQLVFYPSCEPKNHISKTSNRRS